MEEELGERVTSAAYMPIHFFMAVVDLHLLCWRCGRIVVVVHVSECSGDGGC